MKRITREHLQPGENYQIKAPNPAKKIIIEQLRRKLPENLPENSSKPDEENYQIKSSTRRLKLTSSNPAKYQRTAPNPAKKKKLS